MTLHMSLSVSSAPFVLGVLWLDHLHVPGQRGRQEDMARCLPGPWMRILPSGPGLCCYTRAVRFDYQDWSLDDWSAPGGVGDGRFSFACLSRAIRSPSPKARGVGLPGQPSLAEARSGEVAYSIGSWAGWPTPRKQSCFPKWPLHHLTNPAAHQGATPWH